jgi:hypothetical protein
MWYDWNAPQIERELRAARDQLGINTVRILLPYASEVKDGVRQRVGGQLPKLRQIARIAGDLDLRLIVTLFDFDDVWPQPNSEAEADRIEYVRLLLGNFVGDDRIIAWDLHNEPDHYKAWQNGKVQQVLGWLGRLADEVHRIAPNHLVTVGMGFYENFLQRGPDGRRVIDYSDLISMHSYNRSDIARQLDVLRAHTAKPIVIEEFGWPTGNTCLARNYNEAEQEAVYRDVLGAAKGRTAGVIAWTLRDFDPGPTQRWETREDYYGLFRPDGTLKPAAKLFAAYSVPPLPSALDTAVPLTRVPGPSPDKEDESMLVPGSTFYVKRLFRQAWDNLGGRAMFGLPIGEAYTIPGDKPDDLRVIQYFEAGAFELTPVSPRAPGFASRSPADKAMLQMKPFQLGRDYTAAKGISTGDGKRVASIFDDFYDDLRGSWRLGKPITDAFVEDLGSVQTRVQYFEKGRLQLNPTTGRVEFGQLGRWAWEAKCAAAPVQ